MKAQYYFLLWILSFVPGGNTPLAAQERVYVSTDKEYYLAGESVWYTVYCLDESNGKAGFFSTESSLAYLEFHNTAGLAATVKTALIDGRGCGKFEIPFSLPTGNYSIVAYTKQSGGNSTVPFRGKIITLFNTLTNERAKGGVELVDSGKAISTESYPKRKSRDLAIEVQVPTNPSDRSIPVHIKNTGGKQMSVNISVYQIDSLSQLIGEYGYDHTNLLDRKGEFQPTGEVEYEGEIIHARLRPREGMQTGSRLEQKNVCLSVLGGKDDFYLSTSDSLGNLTYYTGNIYGQPDVVFDVLNGENITRIYADDTSHIYTVEITNPVYTHKPEPVPVLKLSVALSNALSERSQRMQISRRFDADTLFSLLKYRKAPLLSTVKPFIYNLDEYTRFPLMEEVVREYVAELRLRTLDGRPSFQVLLTEGMNTFNYSNGYSLVLLDGIPMRDHGRVATLDPLLLKQIAIYPNRIILQNIICEGVVNFQTYKGDLGGITLPRYTNMINYKGVQYPLAFTGETFAGSSAYPNYNQTLYWNPIVKIPGSGGFSFNCPTPEYKGEFLVVIEGVDESGNDIHYTTRFSLK